MDHELFDTISSLLEEQAQAAGPERREHPRQAYRCVQLLAPFDGNKLPVPGDFRQVQCHDLSPQGFSFYSYRQPHTRCVVVMLGSVPFQFFVAEIVHVNPARTETGQEFLVGCRFARRLTPSGRAVPDGRMPN